MAFLFRSCFGPCAEDVADECTPTAYCDDTASYASSSIAVSQYSLVRPTSNMWTSSVDPETHRTYYWHRLTKQTTWSKPPPVERSRSYGAESSTMTDYETGMSSTVDEGGDSFRPLHYKMFTMGLMLSLKEVSRDEEEDSDSDYARPTNPVIDEYSSTIDDDTTAFDSSIFFSDGDTTTAFNKV